MVKLEHDILCDAAFQIQESIQEKVKQMKGRSCTWVDKVLQVIERKHEPLVRRVHVCAHVCAGVTLLCGYD